MSASLSSFPHISQRDGDINSVDDCVAACVAMGLEFLTGRKYTAGEIKDAVYGSAYTGGTAAVNYEAYCAGQGVSLSPINGNGQQLVAALKAEISAGHPCVVTEPDPYEAGWSHCCAAYAFNTDQATITVVDPWIDADVTKSDATWAAQLLYSQIWTMRRTAPAAPVEGSVWVSTSQEQQAQSYWNSTGLNATYESGIAQSWQSEYKAGRIWGPPLTHEFDSVDWSGTPIKAQMFAAGRCEWHHDTGAKWYAWT